MLDLRQPAGGLERLHDAACARAAAIDQCYRTRSQGAAEAGQAEIGRASCRERVYVLV